MSKPSITIAAFYKFIALSNLDSLKAECKQFCEQHHIFGTLLLAKEGLNATLAGSEESIQAFLSFIAKRVGLEQDENLDKLECKFSYTDFIPFQKLKVLIKKEIITMNVPDLDPEHCTGIRLNPMEWNNLIAEEDVVVIDTRNQYEIEHGTFTRAINPHTEKFSDFPDFVKKQLGDKQDRKIAMFCTGGIRCEKASSYLLENGFKEVYQLHGGILNYLTNVEPKQSLWQGKCFVFDERVVL